MPALSQAEGFSSVRRRFIGLAIPNVLAGLAVPLAGLVDTAMLGRLPVATDLAAVALASIVFDYLYLGLGFLRMSTTGLTARALGRGDPALTADTLVRAVLIAGVLGSIVLALKQPISQGSVLLLNPDPAIRDSSSGYMGARLWGAPAVLANMAIVGWLLGMQASGRVLVMNTVGAVVNIGLDYLFIYTWGWGAMGAGYATAVSQGVVLATGFVLAVPLLREGFEVNLHRWLDLTQIRRYAALSGDLVIRTLALLSAFSLFTYMGGRLGTETVASNSVVLAVLMLSAYLLDGYAHATESMAGLAHAAGDAKGLRRTLKVALVLAVSSAMVFAAVFCLFPQLFGLLTDQPELLERIAPRRFWLVPLLLAGSVAYVLDGYYIGLAAGRTMRRAMVVSFAVGFLPWVGFQAGFGITDRLLWVGLCCFMAARALTLGAVVPQTFREAR